ncbi:MAG: PD40 domain-containing protein [Paraprevotella sp.]|nr:PD40 domain-containing protein [Paraprevotella sp.]
MRRKFYLLVGIVAMVSISARSAEGVPSWLRGNSISPDGSTLAFCYRGDIFTVPTKGGLAKQITTHTAYDTNPVWSPDGKSIAFNSDREGSMDVYLVHAEGGAPKRLTTHSRNEMLLDFLDNENVLFAAYGTPTTTDIQFPSTVYTQVYKVGVKANRPELYSELTMADVNVGPKGMVLYSDVKGYEDKWRKHHTSSITRDIWLYDGTDYKQLTTFNGEDREPVWAADGKGFYYLSEQDGTFNVYYRTLDDASTCKQLTQFKGNPVRYLNVSKTGVLSFSYDGELYTLEPGKKPAKVNVEIVQDNLHREAIKQLISGGASEVSVSPKNKEIAFIANGDVFVTSLDYTTTKQITQTPERERTIDFAPDGRSLVYASERNGVWQVFQTKLIDESEKNFTYCTQMKEERLTDGKKTSFQPQFSPDGKKIAFLEERTALCVMSLDNKKITTVMPSKWQYSYTDGDQNYSWSPDSKWLLTQYLGTGGWNIPDIALVRADGKGEIVNLTNSGYSDRQPQWVLDGKAMIFKSDRAGYRSHGSWGAEDDMYIMFFDVEAYERFRMNKEELALLEEREKAEKEEKKKAEEKAKEEENKKKSSKKDKKEGDDVKKDEKKDKEEEYVFNLDNLDMRTIRLTPYSTSIASAVLSKDGSKLFYVAPHANAYALWIQHIRDGRNELKMQGVAGSRFDMDADLKNAYHVSGGQIKKLELESGRTTNIPFETFWVNQPFERRKYLFKHIWHQTKEKLYDPGMNGADWDKLYTTYYKYLDHIDNGYDFAEMASELLGELNVSHTGCRFGGNNWAYTTASLGVFLDNEYKGDGLKIKEIIAGSPLDMKRKQVSAGCVIEKIDGEEIKDGVDYNYMLAGKVGRYTRLTIKPINGKSFDLTIKPISQGSEIALLYKRWVRRNEKMVDSLSNGRLAYVHIEAMNSASFRELYRDLLGDKNRNRDAVIVDTRHNGGGWLHNDVCILLSGKRYAQYTPRGQFVGNDPHTRWVKPSCMLVCEDNYSNAHGTPWLYQQMGIGKLIGAPVPGTMTAVWWDSIGDGFVFGIPQVGTLDNKGEYLENQQLMPDVIVTNTPKEQLSGVDRQIERAVKELLQAK